MEALSGEEMNPEVGDLCYKNPFISGGTNLKIGIIINIEPLEVHWQSGRVSKHMSYKKIPTKGIQWCVTGGSFVDVNRRS